MKNLFIISNDTDVINKLKTTIDWKSLGFNVCRETSDAENALSKVLSKHSDLVILDTDVAAVSQEWRSFFLPREHELGLDESKEESDSPPHYDFLPLTENQLTELADSFSNYMDACNRQMMGRALSELETRLSNPSYNVGGVKLLLTDLYLQVKANMSIKHAAAEIPFETNAFVIEYIYNRRYLYEIIDFLLEQFDMIISAIKSPSINTVMDNVRFYIDHNYTKNIRLETVAQLFGYNNAYLGKIFHQYTGESFNSYIDHKRIEYSKRLILENKLKVYEIAREVGYGNVNYFHKKFKKYVGTSPSAYRKQMAK